MLVDVAALAVGLVLLALAADRFVVSAARLATELRVSPLVVGTILVGFGTSTPELLVSGVAAGQGDIDIAVGNVVGSNLANLTLVLGGAALVSTAHVVPGVLRREGPVSLGAVALFAVLVQGGLSRVEGAVLVAALVVAAWLLLRSVTTGAPGEVAEAIEEIEHEVEELEARRHEPVPPPVRVARDVALALVGLLGTVAGAQLLVAGARGIAEEVGLSGGFVGLTLVAIGTSLPELVTGVQSMRRGQSALLIGNVLGSNMFNSLGVGAVIALVGPGAITDASLTVIAVVTMVGVAVLGTLFLRGGRVDRREAAVLLLVYFATLPLMA